MRLQQKLKSNFIKEINFFAHKRSFTAIKKDFSDRRGEQGWPPLHTVWPQFASILDDKQDTEG